MRGWPVVRDFGTKSHPRDARRVVRSFSTSDGSWPRGGRGDGSQAGQGKGAGTIRIEEECWIGFGTVIVCEQGELVIGRHCGGGGELPGKAQHPAVFGGRRRSGEDREAVRFFQGKMGLGMYSFGLCYGPKGSTPTGPKRGEFRTFSSENAKRDQR